MDCFSFGLQLVYVEVQEKQDALWGILRTLESDDRRVLVNFGSPTNSKLKFEINIIIVCQIPVDPAGGHCYWDSTKPCESRGFGPRLTAQ